MNCCNANGQCTQAINCPVDAAMEMPMPKVITPGRIYTCDALGVCNCSGQQCEFELPDLGPMSLTEAAFVVVLLLASAACSVGLIKWVVDNFGSSISASAKAFFWLLVSHQS